GERLRIAVHDTGIGIKAEALQRIMERFTQADTSTTRRYGGTGLGLAIRRRLVDLMGGEMTVKSEEGRGSEFAVILPLVAGDPGSAEPAPLAKMRRVIVLERTRLGVDVAASIVARLGATALATQ